MGGKWHMLPLVDVADLEIKIRRCLRGWLVILVEDGGIS